MSPMQSITPTSKTWRKLSKCSRSYRSSKRGCYQTTRSSTCTRTSGGYTTSSAPVPVENTETVYDAEPLAENNIPTEIHVNKYLASWGDKIQVHCEAHGIENVKKLMLHLNVEVNDFLENYKGK